MKALSNNLQTHIYHIFMKKLAHDLPEYERGLKKCIKAITDDFKI